MSAITPINVFRGSEIAVEVTLKLRNNRTGQLSDPDISSIDDIKFKILPNLKKGTAATIEKTQSSGDITVVTDGTGGALAVIRITLTETDTDLDPRTANYWQAFVRKNSATTPYEPGRFTIQASGDY